VAKKINAYQCSGGGEVFGRRLPLLVGERHHSQLLVSDLFDGVELGLHCTAELATHQLQLQKKAPPLGIQRNETAQGRRQGRESRAADQLRVVLARSTELAFALRLLRLHHQKQRE
jgi:hypothetical protein